MLRRTRGSRILGYTHTIRRSDQNSDSYRGEYRLTPWVVSERWCVRAAFAATLAAMAPSCYALSFGAEQVTSSLGQPLRMSIPLLATTGDSLDARCFRIASPSRADGLPVVTQARIELEPGAAPRLLVRSDRPVDEPAVRIAVEATCDTPIRRDYTVLLDPPSLAADRPAAATLPPIAPPVTERGERAANANATASVRVGGVAPSTRNNDRRTAGRKPPASGPGSAPHGRNKSARPATPAATANRPARAIDELRVQGGGTTAGGVAIEDASIAALAIPRLRISRDLPGFDAAAPTAGASAASTAVSGGNELQAAIAKERRNRLFATPIDEDLAPRLEADLVVAQRRLAELQAQIAAAGGAVAAAGTPPNAKSAGNPSASKAATAEEHDAVAWDWKKWLWVPASLLVLGLLAFLVRQRRAQRADMQFANAGPVTVVQTGDEFDTVLPTRTGATATGGLATNMAPTPIVRLTEGPATVTAAAGAAMSAKEASEASDRLISPLFQLRDTESHVDVSELSQITDEAQVYADLGRNDQAIEILRAHIDSQEGQDIEHASPAPWLMIFDLYRRTNNRAGYDELAPRFRKQFNGRMPDWDNYGHELALDDGLEAFPHLVARIERDWGTPEAKKFLEELLYDNRGGSRLGFSLAAYRDILLLLQLHEGIATGAPGDMAIADWESRGANDSDGTPKWDLELDMIEPPETGELDSFLRNRPAPDKS